MQNPQNPIRQVQGLAQDYRRYAKALHKSMAAPERPDQEMGYPIVLTLDDEEFDAAFMLARRPSSVLDRESIEQMRSDTAQYGYLISDRAPDPDIWRHPVNKLRGQAVRTFNVRTGQSKLAVLDEPLPDGFSPDPPQRGWMLDYLAFHDVSKRWLWWHKAYHGGQFSEDIPFIRFEEPEIVVRAFIDNTLNYIVGDRWETSPDKWKGINYLFDWILWSVGHPLQPTVPYDPWSRQLRTFDWAYQLFDIQSILLFPADYMGDLIRRASADGSRPLQPTLDQAAANRLAKRLFPHRKADYRNCLMVDPQANSGSMILAASNFTTKIAATNTDPLLSKAAIINAYFFAPWFVLPFPWLPNETDDDWLEAVGRTNEVMKARKLPRQYFQDTVPINDDSFLPVQQRKRRQPQQSQRIDSTRQPKSNPNQPAAQPTVRRIPRRPIPRQLPPNSQALRPLPPNPRQLLPPNPRQLPPSE